MKKKILFICTHNSARSQIAEGLVNDIFGDKFAAFSAGTEKTFVKPFAIEALKDINIDISGAKSKLITEFRDMEFDFVVTVCDSARETCPFFPGTKELIHKSFSDPSDVQGEKKVKLEAFIKTRDEIKAWLEIFLSGK